MRNGRWGMGAILVVALAGWAGCDDGITTPDRDPTMEGILVGMNGCGYDQVCTAMVPERIETVWVKTDIEDPCGVTLTVTGRTDLLVREGSALRRALPGDFTMLRPVRVWIVGDVVAESCPAQGGAEALELQ